MAMPSAGDPGVPCDPAARNPAATPPDLRINGDNLENPLASLLQQPERPVTIEYYPRNLQTQLKLRANLGKIQQDSPNQWRFWPVAGSDNELTLCAGDFVSRLIIRPVVANAALSRTYPDPAASPDPAAYQAPTHFLLVDAHTNLRTAVSPHFQLWQFVEGSTSADTASLAAPQSIRISFALLEKLELVLAVLAEYKVPATTLKILSGYRTPAHNRRVGGARFSRHQYGDAVDFIVDSDNDGKMDDLNQDGQVTRADLNWLTDRLARRAVPVSAGGTGSYESAGDAAAFLHLDARGRDQYWQ